MTTATPIRPARRAPTAPSRARTVELCLGAVAAAVVSGATCWLAGVPTSHLLQTLALYGVLAALIVRYQTPSKTPGLGAANRVTLGRSALILPIAALAAVPGPLGARGYGWVVGLATIAMILDGIDGRVARRTGGATPFGARFDMELDAFLLLALAVLLSRSDKVGSWVVLIGGLRYLFVFAGMLWPALQAPLPPSFRRKTICVWQGVSLLVALAPVTPPLLAALATATSLVLLVWSFAVDTRWLLASPQRGSSITA